MAPKPEGVRSQPSRGVSIYGAVDEALQRGESVALVTVLKTEGSTPQKAGAKMLVGRDGRLHGTVGGGCVESEICRRARVVLQRRKLEILSYDFDAEEGLICGGTMTVLIEPVLPPPRVYIVGAGHVSVPLCRVAKIAGFEVVVIDDRMKYANRERFPEADIVRAGPIADLSSELAFGDNVYVVIVTRGHKMDEEALRLVLQYDTAYVGVIGSVEKSDKIFERLERDGFSREKLDRVHSPIGLDIGGGTPGEIAVSIVAELLAVRYGRSGKPMARTRRGEV